MSDFVAVVLVRIFLIVVFVMGVISFIQEMVI